MRVLRHGVAALAIASLLVGTWVDPAASSTADEPADASTVEAPARWHLDTSFGTDGFTVVGPEPGEPRRKAGNIAVQPDGKIVVAAWTVESGMGVFRLLPDGELDSTFGDDGFAGWPDGPEDGGDIRVGLQNVGTETKILAFARDAGPRLRIWRFNADGTPDDADDADPDVVFGDGGLVEYRPPKTRFSYRFPMYSVGPDQSILVTSPNRKEGYRGAILVRFDRDGTPDRDFGPHGVLRIGGIAHESVTTTTGSGQLRIISAGSERHGPAWTFRAYTTDGFPDQAYGIGGLVMVTPPDSQGICHSDRSDRWLGLLPNGDLVAAGHPCVGEVQYVESAVRLTSDGELDLGFGEDGWASPLDPEVREPVLWDAAVHSDGSVVWGNELDRWLVFGGVRPDGAPDPRYGADGLVRIALPDDPLFNWALFGELAFDDQGRIVASATVYTTDGRNYAVVGRLTTG